MKDNYQDYLNKLECEVWMRAHVFDGEFTTMVDTSNKFGISVQSVNTIRKRIVKSLDIPDYVKKWDLLSIQRYLMGVKRKKENPPEPIVFTRGLKKVMEEDINRGSDGRVKPHPTLDQLDKKGR